MAKKKIGLLGIILLAVPAVGLILTVVGVAVPWFTADLRPLGTKTYGLFAEGLGDLGKLADFPIAPAQAFALLALILGTGCCVLVALEVFGVFGLPRSIVGFVLRIVLVALTGIFAILAMALGLAFADKTGLAGNAGAYLTLIGGILACVPLVLSRK